MLLSKKIFSLAATLIAIGIAAAAFGAHGLKDTVSPERLVAYQTAGLYHLLNAFGLMILAIAQHCNLINATWLKRISTLLVLGILLFSGSLYLLVILDMPRLGIVTPFGGTMLIIAWVLAAISSAKS